MYDTIGSLMPLAEILNEAAEEYEIEPARLQDALKGVNLQITREVLDTLAAVYDSRGIFALGMQDVRGFLT